MTNRIQTSIGLLGLVAIAWAVVHFHDILRDAHDEIQRQRDAAWFEQEAYLELQCRAKWPLDGKRFDACNARIQRRKDI